MPNVIVPDAICPACGEEFECEFDPEQEVNDIDCPECNSPLMVEAYDPKRKKVILVEAEDEDTPDLVDEEDCELCGKSIIDCECPEEDEEETDAN
jgi:DNA-directed RNA polymerase subunit RPC12/RpoP